MIHTCDRCDHPATVHLTEIKSGEKSERHLCEECARALHVPQPSKELQKLLKSFEPLHSMSRRHRTDLARACPECGMTYAEFRQHGRFGCARDYEVFGKDVLALLKRIHGSSRYTGKAPGGRQAVRGGELLDEIAVARARLASAIDEEDYEEAARLRDEIRRMAGGDGADEPADPSEAG